MWLFGGCLPRRCNRHHPIGVIRLRNVSCDSILEHEVLNSPNSYVGNIIVLPAISAQCNKQVVWSRKPYGNPYALASTKPTSPNSYVFGVCISLSGHYGSVYRDVKKWSWSIWSQRVLFINYKIHLRTL